MTADVGPDPETDPVMTPERWAAVTRVVQGALERGPTERAAFVAAACGSDPTLRAEVDSLLAAAVAGTSIPGVRAAVWAAAANVSEPASRLATPVDAARVAAALAGRYEIGGVLGRGGMAAVYRARDVRHGRTVAVKVLDADVAAALGPQRFLREIDTAAHLSHPRILPLFDSGEAGGLLYYVMPYVAGGTLGDRLAAAHRLPLDEAVRVLRDVALALAYAHDHGVVHRDVKPENVLLHEGTAVVSDFGIATALTDPQITAAWTREQPIRGPASGALTQLGTSLGTPAYMAPEQAAGDGDVDARADLYAWGVMAYTLLAGRHPFASRATAHELIAAHLSETPVSLRTIAPGVPAHLAALVMRCLAKTPAQRPASAAELLAALDRDRVVAARPLVRRAEVGAVAALAVLGLAGAAWRARTHRLDTPPPDPAPLKIAVLPFEHAGPANEAVFTDGLTDAVTAKLGALPGLAVIDRHSAAQYAHVVKPATQIGAELGARWLVEGVVRWARDGAGRWRAQVTPTLVDARTGITAWTGEPAVITPTDPFTAQTQVATTVAGALRVALRPADRATLERRLTDNPQALAAYMRARALFDAGGRTFSTAAVLAVLDQSAAEFSQAVALDPGFGDAWADLTRVRFWRAREAFGDTAAVARLRTTLAEARAYAPENPGVLLMAAATRQFIDRDTTGVDALLRRVVAGLPNEPAALRMAGLLLADDGRPDEGYSLLRRAAVLDPRSGLTLTTAASLALPLRRWADARRYADGAIALDSADERGWIWRLAVETGQGDTLGMQRVAAAALARLPHAGPALLSVAATADVAFGPVYRARSAHDLGIATLVDSVEFYYDAKSDVCLRRGALDASRVYSDSIRRLLARRPLTGPDDDALLAYRAFAEANLGDTADARSTLARALRQARSRQAPADSLRVLVADVVAGTYARLDDPGTAVRWLEADLANPRGGSTARGFAARPKLYALRGTPAFARLLREHAP
ncbi:MAG TPA: protein kinase [Gemmatirosa sp.]